MPQKRLNKNTNPPLYTIPIPKTTQPHQEVDKSLDLEISIIGPQSCGKTTYIGSLLSCKYHSDFMQQVEPKNEESKKFQTEAKNTLPKGDYFNPTPLAGSSSDLKPLSFSLALGISNTDYIKLVVESGDFSGELFGKYFKLNNEIRKTYINACAKSQSILLLLSAQESENDDNYANVIENIFREILAKGWSGRIAVALTKCEDIMIYTQRRRLGSEGLIKKKFPLTLRSLKQVCLEEDVSIGYFSMSAFGMKGNKLISNVNYIIDPIKPDQINACVEEPTLWRPFGMFAPLYWLGTGENIPNQYQN